MNGMLGQPNCHTPCPLQFLEPWGPLLLLLVLPVASTTAAVGWRVSCTHPEALLVGGIQRCLDLAEKATFVLARCCHQTALHKTRQQMQQMQPMQQAHASAARNRQQWGQGLKSSVPQC